MDTITVLIDRIETLEKRIRYLEDTYAFDDLRNLTDELKAYGFQ